MNKQTKLAVIFSLGFVALFCSSFVFFYTRAQNSRTQKKTLPSAISPNEIDKKLPNTVLVGKADTKLQDDVLHRGKVVLTFVHPDCRACDKESDFLKTVVGKRSDVSFYGIIPFAANRSNLEAAVKKYPFQVFYDESSHLAASLQITSVPVKLYLEDGIIKKVWEGASVDEKTQQEFVQWLSNLQ
jgi:hypothetical protein